MCLPVWAAKHTAERLFYTAEFDSLFMEGLCYMHADSLTLAQNRFEACAKLQPKSAAVAFQLSSLYALQQDTVRSIDQLKKATKLNPKNYFYHTNLAEIYTNQSQYKEAIKIYKKLTTLFPDKDYPFYMLSRCYFLMGDFKNSVQAYTQLEKRIGVNPEIAIEKVLAIAYSGDLAGTEQAFQALYKKYPLNDDLYFREGAIYYGVFKDMKRALACFEKTLEVNPDHSEALRYACDLYDQMGNQAKVDECMVKIFASKNILWEEKKELLKIAVKYYKARPNYQDIITTLFKKMIMVDSSNEELWTIYNDYLIQMNQLDKALEAMNTCIGILPTCELCHLQRYELSKATKSHQETEKILDETLQALPNHPLFLCSKAIFRYSEGDPSWQTYAQQSAQAINDSTHLEIALYVYTTIGLMYGESNRLTEGVLYNQKAYELNPNDATSANNYAFYLALIGKELDKAAQISYKTIQQEPLNSSFLHTYAYILMQQGKWEYAKFYMHQAIEYDKQTTPLLYEDYAKILEHLGEKQEAQKMRQLAKEIEKKNETQQP